MLVDGFPKNASEALRKGNRVYFLLKNSPKFPVSTLLLIPSFIVLFTIAHFASGDIRTLGRPAKA
jgi:hypothetical protein